MAKKKDLFVFFLKLIVSFSILGYIIFKKAPLSGIGQSMEDASLFWIALSFSLHALIFLG